MPGKARAIVSESRLHIDGFSSVEDKKVLKVQPITPETDEQDLTEAFEQFGKVIRVRIPKHPDSNKLKGFAFIHFEQERHAAAALYVSVFRFGGAQ